MMKNVYVTKRIVFDSNRVSRKDYSRKISIVEFGIFSSKKKAEQRILDCVKEIKDSDEKLFGFFVEERPVDYDLTSKVGTWETTVSSEWSYLADGTPFSYSPFSSDWNVVQYMGTNPDAIKFKENDLAWMVYGHDTILPVKVVYPPYTTDEWKKKFVNNDGKVFASDISDDCYLIMTAKRGHMHPLVTLLFPFDGNLPNDILKEIDDQIKNSEGPI